MLITRTEMFTDWVFQGAHAGEQAATVGRGLMRGHIYFRYADDFLKAGETIQREISFVELSDGSTYELGGGESAEKINIIDRGVVSGEVHLEVSGTTGVGVNRILRHVTIQYDDGKIPVLDTEQLDVILDSLSESLTDSMVDTANAVKQELRNELQTGLANVQVLTQNLVQEGLNGVTTEVADATNKVSELEGELNDWTGTVEDSLEGIRREIGSLNIPAVHYMQCATPGQYTIDAGGTNNLVAVKPVGMGGSTFVYDNGRKSIKVAGGAHNKDRMLRVTITSNIELRDGADGVVYVGLRNGGDDSVGAQQVLYVNANKMGGSVSRVQFSVETLIAANDGNHPALTTGYKLVVANKTGANVIFSNSATLTFTLLTV